MMTKVLDNGNALAHWWPIHAISKVQLAKMVLTGPPVCGLVYDLSDRTDEQKENLVKAEGAQQDLSDIAGIDLGE